MIVVKGITVSIALLLCAACCGAEADEGRSLGFLKPFGGGGQTVHYERFGGGGGGYFGKQPGYGYESYTSTAGGYGKPFFGHGFGHGYGHGFGQGYGSGFGHGYGPGFGHGYPGYGNPYYPYPGFGPGFGYFK